MVDKFEKLAARLVVLNDCAASAQGLVDAFLISHDDLRQIKADVETEVAKAMADYRAEPLRCYVIFVAGTATVYYDIDDLIREHPDLSTTTRIMLAGLADFRMGGILNMTAPGSGIGGVSVLVADPRWLQAG